LPLARGQNIDGAAERLQNLQDLPNLGRWLAGFEIDNEAKTDASNSGKLILPQVLLLACRSHQDADIGWTFDLSCHLNFPIGKIAEYTQYCRGNFPIGKNIPSERGKHP